MDESQLRAAADEAAVMKLIARLAQLADTGELTDYARCLADDARWILPADSGVDLPAQVRSGVGDIIAGAQQRRDVGMQGPGSGTRHVVSTIVVDVDGDRATGRAYWRYYASTVDSPVLRTMGQYDDEFIRTPDGWKLRCRRITPG